MTILLCRTCMYVLLQMTIYFNSQKGQLRGAGGCNTLTTVFLARLQDFERRVMQLMLDTDGSRGCPMRRGIEKLMEARCWAFTKVLEHIPVRMMRIGAEVRANKLKCGRQDQLDTDKQRRVLVMPCLLFLVQRVYILIRTDDVGGIRPAAVREKKRVRDIFGAVANLESCN